MINASIHTESTIYRTPQRFTENRDELGRSIGYAYANNGSVQQTVSTGYDTDGRIATAGFLFGGAQKTFSYAYLPGTHLLQSLTKPNNMSLTLSYEEKRDLLIGMSYKRSNTGVASRTYSYDAAGRPTTRSTARNGQTVTDSFGYNNRSELTTATVGGSNYAYGYDNIGNRNTAQEAAEVVTNYSTNNLNQYTAIGDFTPAFDAAGNRTLVKTTTGIWTVAYDAENRPVSFTNTESNTVIECSYDYMGRRATKKVTVNGSVTLHHRYLYRGYLQIACCDLTRSSHPCLWLITWDPTQPIATRPLAIQKDGTWYTYGWDLTKNICEVYGQHGYIRTNYTYTPYGAVTASGDVTQPIQWSSAFHDTELALIYYNYRHYNPTDGRWLGRDRREELESINLYAFVNNKVYITDYLGDVNFYQTCTNFIREEYDDFWLQQIEKLKNTINEHTWTLVEEDLKKWLNGEQPASTTYMESDPRTQAIMNSYIGARLRELFMKKNKNVKLCNEWRGMTNISIKLPNLFTVINLMLSTIFLKHPFIGLTEQSKLEIKRFIISILKGSTAFVGSVSANIYVTKQKDGNKDYILATYHVYNTVSKQSYYLRQPDFITDFIFDSNLKNWEQHYYWTEKHDCIDMTVDCIDPCIYMHMVPGNPFSPLM